MSTIVSAAKLVDASGAPVTNAKIYFQPCDPDTGVPIPFTVGGGGQSVYTPVYATITDGAFSITLEDTALTEPQNVAYAVTVRDVSGRILLSGYKIQPTGATWSFDTNFSASTSVLSSLTPIVLLFTNRGAWAPSTAYNRNDYYMEGRSSYLVQTAYTSGATFGATDTTNAALWAAGGTDGATGATGATGAAGGTGGAFGTTTPLIARGAGAVGSAGTSSQSDHVHPAELEQASPNTTNGLSIQTNSTLYKIPAYDGNGKPQAFAVADSQGNRALWIDNQGVVNAADLTVVGTLTLPTGIDVPIFGIGDTTITNIPTNAVVSGSIIETDSVGNITRRVDLNGNQHIGADLKVKGTASALEVVATAVSAASVSATLGYNGSLTGAAGTSVLQLSTGAYIVSMAFMGRTNIYSLTGTTVKQLTLLGNNAGVGLSGSGTTIYFVTDRHGQSELWSMNTDGGSQTKVSALQDNTPTWLYYPTTGQSLPNGYEAGLALPYPLSNTYMFNGGTRVGTTSGVLVAPASSMTSLVTLAESQDGTINSGETMCTGFAARATKSFGDEGYIPNILMSVSAVNGYSLAQISKGTQPYANIISEATAAASLAPGVVIPALLLSDGEADDTSETAAFGSQLLTLQANYQADLQAITGQWSNIPVICRQIASWTCTKQSDRATPYTPQIVDATAQANPGKIICACPSYMFPYVSSDGIHVTAAGQRWMAEYYAKAAEVYRQTGDFKGVYPTAYSWTDVETLVVTFNTPVEPLVIDTTLVSEPTNVTGGMYGFEYVDGGSTVPAISSITVSASNQLTFVFASATTAGARYLLYAYTGVVGANAGPTTGARGNLRDSDPYPSLFGNTLYNWCRVFNYPVG